MPARQITTERRANVAPLVHTVEGACDGFMLLNVDGTGEAARVTFSNFGFAGAAARGYA